MELDGSLQGYILHRLDEMRKLAETSHEKLDEMADLLRNLPAAPAPVMVEAPSLLSRLEKWLPWLQQVGTMAIKHAITVLMVIYMVKGGDVFQAAGLLLKLL